MIILSYEPKEALWFQENYGLLVFDKYIHIVEKIILYQENL